MQRLGDFRKLTPAQQRRMRERWREFNTLTPAQKQRLRERFRKMSPQDRARALERMKSRARMDRPRRDRPRADRPRRPPGRP
jgi:hypothetical protein